MNQTLAAWLLIILALFCANLPFVNERVFGVFGWRRGGASATKAAAAVGVDGSAEVLPTTAIDPTPAMAVGSASPAVKPLWARLLEVVVLYFVVGGLGWAFESTLGNRFSQGGEFYAVTFSLFLVLAYPGFVYRYLFRRHGKRR